eukprot:364166-Chlamydomonas_euryale.AAC.8
MHGSTSNATKVITLALALILERQGMYPGQRLLPQGARQSMSALASISSRSRTAHPVIATLLSIILASHTDPSAI